MVFCCWDKKQTIYLNFLWFHNDLIFSIIYGRSTVSKTFWKSTKIQQVSNLISYLLVKWIKSWQVEYFCRNSNWSENKSWLFPKSCLFYCTYVFLEFCQNRSVLWAFRSKDFFIFRYYFISFQKRRGNSRRKRLVRKDC